MPAFIVLMDADKFSYINDILIAECVRVPAFPDPYQHIMNDWF